MRVVGFDPGLRNTGWGVIESDGTHLRHVANGTVKTDSTRDLAQRLVQLHDGVVEVLRELRPDHAAVEMTLVNKNASSTLKLGIARGIVLFAPAAAGLQVVEYLPMVVKKSVVGTGHAVKAQVGMMVQRLLPGCVIDSADSADALAVAICHSHHAATGKSWAQSDTQAADLRASESQAGPEQPDARHSRRRSGRPTSARRSVG